MHEASLDIVVDVESFMLLGKMFCVYCFSHLPSLLLLSGFCFLRRSIQPVLQFISLIINNFDLFFCVLCLHKTSVQYPAQIQRLWRFVSCVPPGHHSIFRPCENLRAASPHDGKRSVGQVPFPPAALLVPAQYGGCAGHTDQQLRPQPGGDPYRRPKPSEPQHPLLQHHR